MAYMDANPLKGDLKEQWPVIRPLFLLIGSSLGAGTTPRIALDTFMETADEELG